MRIFLIISFLCLLCTAVQAGEPFFETLYDVPIMEGLEEIEDKALIFDKPGGRIAEAAAIIPGDITAETVKSFYSEVLPQLGWQKQADDRYRRKGEELAIFYEKSGVSSLIRFRLSPIAP